MRQDKIPIRISEGIIPVYAQIVGPTDNRTIRMALDTGASYTMIPPERVLVTGHKLPIPRKKVIKIFTASGIEYVPLVTIYSLRCMGVTVRNIEVIAHDLPQESPVEGLLGLNFLIHFPPFIEFCRKIHPYI